MKRVKVNISKCKNAKNEKLGTLINEALQFDLSPADEMALLIEIRKGNQQAIEQLVKASSSLIYKMIERHPSDTHSTSQQFSFAQDMLRKLAHSELNSTKRERYLRFQAFYIQQALLNLEE